jgi:hypothetical protein
MQQAFDMRLYCLAQRERERERCVVTDMSFYCLDMSLYGLANFTASKNLLPLSVYFSQREREVPATRKLRGRVRG